MNAWHIAAIVCFGGSCLTLYGMQSAPEVAIPFFTALSVASLFCGYMGMSANSGGTVIRDSYNTVHNHHYAAQVQAQAAEIERLRQEMIKLQKRLVIAEIEVQPVIQRHWREPVYEDIGKPEQITAEDPVPPSVGLRGVLQSIARGASGGQQALPATKGQAVALVRQGREVAK